MRSILLVMAWAITLIAPAAAQAPEELSTAADAILCLNPENLATANHPSVARSQLVLRAMGCLRVDSGIRSRLLAGAGLDSPWHVRFYPVGISAGVVLWGLPSSFTAPDGSQVVAAKRTGP